MRLKNRKISPKSRLFTFGSHPHGVFLYWHLPKLHYEKWVQKSPEAASPLGFLGVASIFDAQYGGATRNPPSHPVGGGTTRSGGTFFFSARDAGKAHRTQGLGFPPRPVRSGGSAPRKKHPFWGALWLVLTKKMPYHISYSRFAFRYSEGVIPTRCLKSLQK